MDFLSYPHTHDRFLIYSMSHKMNARLKGVNNQTNLRPIASLDIFTECSYRILYECSCFIDFI